MNQANRGPARVAEHVNAALHALFERYDNLHLLGEDVADPYGGAFKVTKGLSTAYPDRVRNTPVSESGIIGVAGGMALCGDLVIAEVMFGDFITLGFDQIVNFAAKSVAMYGRRRPMRLVVRAPVGGHRGYGPTHSQSPQKHFMGIPHLALYELSALHDPRVLFERALDRGEPAIVFEPKTLYAQRGHRDGRIDELLGYEFLDQDGNWAHVHAGPGTPQLVVVAPGGTAGLAIEAARALIAGRGIRVSVLVPARLYPLDAEPILDLVRGAAGVCVAEESTAGGTWGGEVARQLYERLWGVLPQPVRLLSSRDSVIPAAPHLEREVLLSAQQIGAALEQLLNAPDAGGVEPAPAAPQPEEQGFAVTVPKLNNNDESYTLIAWLEADGAAIGSGDPVAEIETSKALEELVAGAAGTLRHVVSPGSECRPGDMIGRIQPTGATSPGAGRSSPHPVTPTGQDHAAEPPVTESDGVIELDRGQQQVAEVVARAHQEVPAAFAVRSVRLDAFDRLKRVLDEADDEPLDLLGLVVKLVADRRAGFPLCFAVPLDLHRARPAQAVHVGVTMDAGNGLFVPVVRDADARSLTDIADELAEYRMRALRGTFTEEQLSGAAISVSWNHQPNVVLVQPLILPGTCCMLSVGGPLEEIRLDPDGTPRQGRAMHIGLAHDHRLVNGHQAVAFLAAVADPLEDYAALEKLVRADWPAKAEDRRADDRGR